MTTTTKTVTLKMLSVWGPTDVSACMSSVIGGSRVPDFVHAIRMCTSLQSAATVGTMYELIGAKNEATLILTSETAKLAGTLEIQ